MVWPLVRLGTHSRNRAALEKRRAEKCSVSRRDEGPTLPLRFEAARHRSVDLLPGHRTHWAGIHEVNEELLRSGAEGSQR